MRLGAIALALAAQATPAAAVETAPTASSLAADAETRWIPFALTAGDQIRFAMRLDGRPVIAILDTGVSLSVIARASPALDRGRVRRGGSASAIGGAVALDRVATRTLEIGALTRSGGELGVAALPPSATGSAAVDLLVGRDVIGDHAIDIDYRQRRFRLLPSGRLPFVGATAPLSLSRILGVYQTEATIGGRRVAPMIVDTGDGSSVTLSLGAWAQSGPSPRPVTTAVSYGLAGPVVSALTILPHLSIGDLDAREVEVRIEAAGGFSQGIDIAGRIGSGFLRRYRVLLDPGAGRMVLAPDEDTGAPPLRSTSGLLVAAEPGRLRVLHVMRGSPADGSWRAGDTICAVNGVAIDPDYATSAQAGWSVATPGTVVRLRLCAGGERRLTTRAFY